MTPDLTTMKPQRPTLYRLAADGRSLDFLFAPCPASKGLSFPCNAPGCMHCGQPLDAVAPIARPGGGTLLSGGLDSATCLALAAKLSIRHGGDSPVWSARQRTDL